MPFPLVLYDEGCRLCTRLAACLERRGLSIAAIGSPAGDLWLRDLCSAGRYDAVHAIDAAGRRASAGAALPVILRALPGGGLPAALATAFPGLAERVYRLAAHHRTTISRVTTIRRAGRGMPRRYAARRSRNVMRASRGRAG